jgi:hypothetical protein
MEALQLMNMIDHIQCKNETRENILNVPTLFKCVCSKSY